MSRNTKSVVPQHRQIGLSLLLLVVECLALCWPTMLNRGQPMVFADTRPYFTAGRAAIDKIGALLHPHVIAGGGNFDNAIQNARAVRSAFYSLLVFLAAEGGSLWLVVLLQAGCVVLLLRLCFQLCCPLQTVVHRSGFIIAMAGLTSVSWVTSTVMPDVFTAVALLAAILLLVFWDDLNTGLRWGLAVTVSASTVMHGSTPLILGGVLCIAAGLRLGRLWAMRARFAMVGGALAMALLMTLTVSVVAFRQWTLAPNQLPFLLARSVADGPGRLYLQKHCPQIQLAMCRHLDRLEVNSDDFLFKENGVYSVVTLDEAAQLRAESNRIFFAAALEHPWLQAGAELGNLWAQIGSFGLEDFWIPSAGRAMRHADIPQSEQNNTAYMQYADANTPEMLLTMRTVEPAWEMALEVPEYLIVGFSLIIIVRLASRNRHFVLLILTAVLLNALVVTISVPAARYGARVIWFIPMLALLAVSRAFNRRALLLLFQSHFPYTPPSYTPYENKRTDDGWLLMLANTVAFFVIIPYLLTAFLRDKYRRKDYSKRRTN